MLFSMMKKSVAALVAISALALVPTANAVPPKELRDVKLDQSIDTNGSKLVLNGAGVRSKFFIKAYIASLYLQNPSKDSEQIMDADEPMAVRLNITSGMITPERMSDSTRDGFIKSTGGNVAPIEKDMETLIAVFSESVEKGDIFDLIYTPGTGVEVFRNGEKKSEVPGLAFKKALFGIWLSEDGIQDSLREDMLDLED